MPMLLRLVSLLLLATLLACGSAPKKTTPVPESAETQQFNKWLALAQKGDPRANYEVGRLYILGKGTDKNIDAAIRHLMVAAQGQYEQAQQTLESIHDKHVAMHKAKDYERSLPVLKALAKYNYIATKFYLGSAYTNKDLHGQHDVQGLPMLLDAAKAGHPQAQFRIGELYVEGRILDRDFQLASQWFMEAAKNGQLEAYGALGRVLHAMGNFELMTQVLSSGIQKGHNRSRLMLAQSYIERNHQPEKAFHLLQGFMKRNKDEKDNEQAHYYLAYLYEYGLGTPVDYQQALEHLQQADSLPQTAAVQERIRRQISCEQQARVFVFKKPLACVNRFVFRDSARQLDYRLTDKKDNMEQYSLTGYPTGAEKFLVYWNTDHYLEKASLVYGSEPSESVILSLHPDYQAGSSLLSVRRSKKELQYRRQ